MKVNEAFARHRIYFWLQIDWCTVVKFLFGILILLYLCLHWRFLLFKLKCATVTMGGNLCYREHLHGIWLKQIKQKAATIRPRSVSQVVCIGLIKWNAWFTVLKYSRGGAMPYFWTHIKLYLEQWWLNPSFVFREYLVQDV